MLGIQNGQLFVIDCFVIPKTPWTGQLISSRRLFLPVLKAQGAGRVSRFWRRPASQFRAGHLLPMCSHGGRVRDLSGVSFIRALIPFLRAPPLWSNHLPKALPPNTITLGTRFQPIYELWGHTNVESVAWLLLELINICRTGPVERQG